MNRALPEMLHYLNTQGDIPSNNGDNGDTDISVLERQQARIKWQQQQLQQQQQQQQQQHLNVFAQNDHQLSNMFSCMPQQQFSGLVGSMIPSLDDLMTRVIKTDPGMENGWPDYHQQLGYGHGNLSGNDQMNQNSLPRMTSCPPTVAGQTVLQRNSCSASVSPKKRKADKNQCLKIATEEEAMKDKRIKGCAEEGDSKITHHKSNSSKGNNHKAAGNCENDNKSKSINSRENSTETSSKEKSKVSEVQKPDYIHVRARRGQATDSHSLAERVRREKISERMKYLQDLVPGCNKITGKAGMLDEIINYVQSLQRQVEFLSMKLATINPQLDFNIDNLFTKEIFPSSTNDFPAIGCPSEMANAAYLQLHSLDQVVSCCGLEMGINPTDMGIRRTISAPVSLPETFIDSSCFNQIQPPSTWDADLQNLYRMEFQQGTSIPFQSQQFTGLNEGSNMKMETWSKE